MFYFARIEEGDGNIACSDCKLFPTKPGQAETIADAESAEIDLLVWQTELLINDENASFSIDWTFHDPEVFYDLVLAWRNAEREIERERAFIHHLFIKSHFKEK